MWIVYIAVSLLVLGCPVEAGGDQEMMDHNIELKARSEDSDVQGEEYFVERSDEVLLEKIRKRAAAYEPGIKVPMRKKRSILKNILKRAAAHEPSMKVAMRKKRSKVKNILKRAAAHAPEIKVSVRNKRALCEPSCKNGGLCSSPNKCTCKDGWTGVACEKRPPDVKFTFVNNCKQDLWIGAQGQSTTNPNCVYDNITFYLPNKGGWLLPQGQTSQVLVPFDFRAGRFWARTGCTGTPNDNFQCETGDCGPWIECAHGEVPRGGMPPMTLAEFTLNEKNKDKYAISLVVGFNLPMNITPKIFNDDSQSNSDPYWCYSPDCQYDINSKCPPGLAVKSNGKVVACNSACMKFKTDKYCCRGKYSSPENCKTASWEHDFAKFPFKDHCPMAYTNAFDDQTSNFFCSNSNYDISFC